MSTFTVIYSRYHSKMTNNATGRKRLPAQVWGPIAGSSIGVNNRHGLVLTETSNIDRYSYFKRRGSDKFCRVFFEECHPHVCPMMHLSHSSAFVLAFNGVCSNGSIVPSPHMLTMFLCIDPSLIFFLQMPQLSCKP
ncbi:hypothetical protein EJF18_30828 [Clavispora lusitaniae]|uniref:Uncharacterized protein n=1 Tax=Clavispora lusitaniae TaxID=36911 RepID=A0ACD0WK63_CLALS|nr:hypothetical protein FOB63_005345 [Clavispora lusitaniae]QFZ27840.1 hypothetical protein EJF14_30828 [Clavispora lusitaniae]QFZ32853.1 hypothetical protein EJF16_30828 [Clavispora lusitaniae]QFZ38523.1 hypothetical protein EJF15_30828 [Clavispora lusitaniae]QFZ44205.1 hypothetical protein EJF18_30828 [Clavispora lusitaniae]